MTDPPWPDPPMEFASDGTLRERGDVSRKAAASMIDLVCSVCGSKNWRDPQPSVDKRWPLIRCMDHTDKRRSPLISAEAFRKRARSVSALPDDVFGALPADERAALAKPIPGYSPGLPARRRGAA